MRKGLCDGAEREKCKAEFGDELDWSCAHCPKKRSEDLHPYTKKLLEMRLLKYAGYPFSPELLEPEEWLDLGRVMQCLETPTLFK